MGVAGLGLLCLLPAKAIPLRMDLEKRWGLEAPHSGSATRDAELVAEKPDDSETAITSTTASNPPPEPCDSHSEIIAVSRINSQIDVADTVRQ